MHSITVNHLLAKLPALKNLKAVSLANSNLSDECCHSLVAMVGQIPSLQSFNISANNGIGPETLRRILVALKQVSNLTDIDLGKLRFSGSEECFREVAAILLSCKWLKTLNLPRVGLDDACAFYLVEAVSRALAL
jgi:Ran GTPase-activating protein (RanGAP) involved in mRNA processing and transport